jgi:selenide, water dikinase
MSELAQVLRPMLPVNDPAALVDASTGDDAAVYDLGDGRALAVTVDFFSPMVDDAFDFGRIAAANALSDIYAMGGRPLFALNVLGFPRALLEEGLVEEIMRGGIAVATNAGIPILGGHTVDDAEPKYGMVCVGEVASDRIVSNAGAEEGDALVLTKPLGTGVIATAIKAGAASPETISAAVASMTTLNRAGAEAMMEVGVNAATDVTGYGLLGHLRRMLQQSGVSAIVESSAVPVFDGIHELIEQGHVPGGTGRNLEDVADDVEFGALDEVSRLTLADAQTSGGLLIAVPEARLEALLSQLEGQTLVRAVIGRITRDGEPGAIRVN